MANETEHEAYQIRKDRRSLEADMLKSSAVYKNHIDMVSKVYGASQTPGEFDQTHLTLVALTSGTKSAVDWTLSRARNHGATEQMIRDTIDVALLTGGGMAVANARFAFGSLRIPTEKS
jgi:hypothetical protein